MVRGNDGIATEESLVAGFGEIPGDAASIAGGKGASLSRMAGAGLPVPPGFIVCCASFRAFLESCNGAEAIRRGTSGLDVNDPHSLAEASAQLCGLVLSQPLEGAVAQAIRSAYDAMGVSPLVAVRSSAASEDGDAASFAGQQETFLNVRGADAVLQRVRECWASLFSPRALFYRAQKGALADARMAVVVQEMALAEKSGVMFTMDPVENRRDLLVVEAVRGLGEGLVSGTVTPEHYVLDRDSGAIVREFRPAGCASILNREELNALRSIGLRLEAFFGKPQDIEWCIRTGELLLLQSRPVTTVGP